MSKKNSQKYSLIAKEYLESLDKKEPFVKHRTIAWGNMEDMEQLFILFGGDRTKVREQTKCIGHYPRFKFVMDKLDRESKDKNAIFGKSYIQYTGIINRPTRCFFLKDCGENPYSNVTNRMQ